MGRVMGGIALAVVVCLVMTLPPSVFAEDLPPIEYTSPENSIPTVPALSEDSLSQSNGTLFRNVVPPVNPVMDAWRHLSPLSVAEEEMVLPPEALIKSGASSITIAGSLSWMAQRLQDAMAEKRRYKNGEPKKSS